LRITMQAPPTLRNFWQMVAAPALSSTPMRTA
jgi:hypothetical protein